MLNAIIRSSNPPESYMALPIVEEDYPLLPEGLPWICGYFRKEGIKV